MSEKQFSLGFGQESEPTVAAVTTKARPPKKTVQIETSGVAPSLEDQARALEQHPDYRVLRRLVPILHFDREPQGQTQRVIVLDTETTGLSSEHDKIIELAMLLVTIDQASGLPCGEVQVYDGLEDPGQPVSKEIEAITGINDAMVKGQRLDQKRINDMLAGVDLVIAHNAAFDRPFVEERLPQFKSLAWGCSFANIDWKAHGHGSSKLEYLAHDFKVFYDAHRAEVDCHALLTVLSQSVAGRTGFSHILDASQAPCYRLQAIAAPFEAKDALKARGYRWNPELRVWHTRLSDEAALQLEFAWLKTAVYGNRSARIQVEKLDAKVNFSSRSGLLSTPAI